MPKAVDLAKKGAEQGKKTAAGFAKSRKARTAEISVPSAVPTPAETDVQESPASTPRHAGGRPPGTRTAQLTLLMDPVLKKILQRDALDRGVSAAHIVDEVLRTYYQEKGAL